jgi:hypothetical protein
LRCFRRKSAFLIGLVVLVLCAGQAIALDVDDSVSYGNAIGAETSISVAFGMRPGDDFSEDKSQGLVRKYSGTTSDPQGGWTFQLRSDTEMRWRYSSGWDGDADALGSGGVGSLVQGRLWWIMRAVSR